MKKILSLILAGLMTVSCAAFVAADDAAVEATTDPVQDYAIEFLANCGVFKGGEGLTNEDLIQRYQMALFVSRISTGWVDDATWEDGTANDATFKDIDTEPASKYLGALSYANQNGIIEGYTANTFAPYASITYRDALTMVVRTLGYKGLSYPWGNIEKAVELGLTEGVDAAYTDELTRGEVAVIIYNAMFAKNSKGETLAKSIFGYDYGFQNIVIVSTDEYGYAANGDRAAAGYVGFKTIDENGALGSKVYYVKASEFGFEGHEEELAVGEVFVALFEIDGDYTNLLDVASLKTATVMNDGITDNEGKAYETMPIAAALKDYTLVKDYTKGILNYTYEDLRVYAYGSVEVFDADDNAKYIGIDADNNIVKYDDANDKWVIEWHYNKELDRYYQFVLDAKYADTAEGATTKYQAADGAIADGLVYVNWMSEKEFNDWYAANIKKLLATYYELKLQDAPATAITSGKAPYAKIDLFDIDMDDKAEIANYKSYTIGIIGKDTTTQKCTRTNNSLDHSAGVVMPAYSIASLDGAKEYVFVEAGHEKHDVDAQNAYAWLNVDASVTTFDETKLDKDGEVVLYNWNKTTGEIEIVKHITEGTNDDADSKIITGVLQAYSTSKKTVTIDGTTYPIAYTNLSGDVYTMADTGIANRTRVGQILDEQYMQYITAVICDGYVVDTDLLGEDEDFIVVLDYAGITSDGYIAVYGYSTDDLTMKVFKINTYNGWKKGDYRYYPENADEDDAFDFGTLYNIKSYDKATNSYGVYTENVDSTLANAKPVRITFQNGYRIVEPMVITYDVVDREEVYRFTQPTDANGEVITSGVSVKKTSSADKYIVVTDDTRTGLTSNIFTFTGNDVNKLVENNGQVGSTNDVIIGMMVDTKVDNKFVIYVADNFFAQDVLENDEIVSFANGAFFMNNAYQVGYVLYEVDNGQVLNAAYDEAIAGDYYLLGSTLSEVRVMNLLTGKRDLVLASSNIDLVNGHIYKTIGGQIIADITDICVENFDNDLVIHNFVDAIEAAYDSQDLERASYIVRDEIIRLTAADIMVDKDTLNTLNLAWAMGFVAEGITDSDDLADNYNGKNVDVEIAKELIKGITMYNVATGDYDWYSSNTAWNKHGKTVVEPLAWKDMVAGSTYPMALIYDVASKTIVAYIDFEDEDKDGKNDNIIDAALTGSISGTMYARGDKAGKWFTDSDLNKWLGSANGYQIDTAMWTINDGTNDRYFTIAVDYAAEITYGDALCKEVSRVELTSLGVKIVEIAKAKPAEVFNATSNKWSAKAIEACEAGIHNLLAAAGVGFGHINNIAKAPIINALANNGMLKIGAVEVFSLTNGDINITAGDECGLVTAISFDLSDVENAILNKESATVIKLTNVDAEGKSVAIDLSLVFDADGIEAGNVIVDTVNTTLIPTTDRTPIELDPIQNVTLGNADSIVHQ